MSINRGSFLRSAATFAGAACLSRPTRLLAAPSSDAVGKLVPIDADLDLLTKITVCLRPFRAAGPRIEAERVGSKTVVHNYGHGGSGWSLSWGSAALALELVASAGVGLSDIAVIGAGAIGLTTGLTAQRAGFRTTIYTKDRFPFVRSARATGSWTPDSRIALTSVASPNFAATWERMARTSFAMYQSYLGVAGNPVEWTDRYIFSDLTSAEKAALSRKNDHHGFADYSDRIDDLTPDWHDVRRADGTLPFGVKRARRTSSLTVNIADYSRQLTSEFYAAGGTIETREFHAPSDLATLPQQIVVNCTGYAARALWSDESVIPVRGQIGWLNPQEGVNYGMYLDNLAILGRRDGIVVQPSPQGDDTGWNDDNETPDRTAAEAGVRQLQAFVARFTNYP